MDEEKALLIHQVLGDLMQAEEDNEAPPRLINNRLDPFQIMTDAEFINLFRMDKALAQELIDILAPHIHQGATYSSLDIRTKVLVALLFYGHGSYQKVTGRNIFCGMSQASVSRCLKEVTLALNQNDIFNNWIKFPQNLNELEELRTRFFRKYNFPGIVGCVDCTHIAIVPPEEDEHIYVNRKHYHSLNVQLICDESLKIMNVVERFPGSAHDAHIWRQCNMSNVMENIYRQNNRNYFFLLGDSGYPLRPWLLTPLRDPIPGTPEDRFNNRLKNIRSIIERCNGVLKNRWRCLLKHRVLHYTPQMAARIIRACCILHNMCISRNIPEPDIEHEEEDDGLQMIEAGNADYQNENQNANLAAARHLQQQIINNYFRN